MVKMRQELFKGPQSPVTMIPVLILLTVLNTALGVDPAGYQGCYKQTLPVRHFSVSPGNYDPTSLTLQTCVSKCLDWNYQYAAATPGTQKSFCFCSVTLSDASNKEPTDVLCNVKCTGDATQFCGGDRHVSVYKTPLPITGVHVITTPGIISEVFNPFTFTVGVRTGTDSMKYEVDADDGYGLEEVDETFTKSFGLPGEYHVKAVVTDTEGLTQDSGSVAVLVEAEVSTVKLLCPTIVPTYEEFTCNATVRSGSHMTASIQFDPAVPNKDTFPIADASWYSGGPAVPDWPTAATHEPNYGLYVMPSGLFGYEGILIGWEFYATRMGGATFVVLRPDCGLDTYCPETNQCAASCSGYSQTCGASDIYCAREDSCTAANLAGTCTTINLYASPPRAFTIVEKMQYNIPSIGKQFYEIDKTLEIFVQPGDTVAYASVSGNGQIGKRTIRAGETEDLFHNSLNEGNLGVVGSSVTDNYNAPGSGEIHEFRAIGSRQARVLFHRSYVDVGVYSVTLEVSNEHITGSETATATVIAQTGINATIIDSPMYGATGENVKFSLEPHTGDNVTYTWDFGDLSVQDTNNVYIEHAYSACGEYNISVIAANLLSSKENSTSIIVEDRIVDLEVDSPGDAAVVGEAHNFSLQMTSGSDYVCNWDFGDGDTLETDSTSPAITPHTYATEGIYSGSVTCKNHVGLDTFRFVQEAQSPIVNLRLDKEGGKEGVDFNLNFRMDQGTAASCKVFFEGTEVRSDFDDATKSGTTDDVNGQVTGLYSVELHCYNLVSDVTELVDFTVDIEITRLECRFLLPDGSSISGNKQDIIQGETLSFYVNMATGSSVEILWDYGDGTNDTFSKGQLVGWDPAVPAVKDHVFDIPGKLDVTITIKNKYDEFQCSYEVQVFNKVDHLTLTSDSPVALTGKGGLVNFFFEVDPGEYPPTGALCAFDFGDDSALESNVPFSLTDKYPHQYAEDGDYRVTVNVSNPLSWKEFGTTAYVIVPVANFHAHVKPPHAVVGKQQDVGLSMDQGNAVTLYWNFGVTSGWHVTKPREGKTPYDVDEASYTFMSVGEYEMTFMASNALGDTTISYLIRSQNGVTDDFVVTSTAPTTFPPGDISVAVVLPDGSIIPTDASIMVDMGDGSGYTAPQTLNIASLPFTFDLDYTYAKAGDYEISVKVFNLASSKEFTISGGVYEAISIDDCTVGYIPELPIDSAPLPGFGPAADKFPLDLPLGLTLTTSGTVVTYEVEAVHTDGTTVTLCNCAGDENPLKVTMPREGVYELRVKAVNPLSTDTHTKRVEMIKRTTGIKLEDPGTLKPTAEHDFKFTMDVLGEGTCLELDMGDGRTLAYGEAEDCRDLARLASLGPLTSPLIVPHTYRLSDQYTIIAKAHSVAGLIETTADVVVSRTDCSIPDISIVNAKDKLDDPREVYPSKRFTVQGKTALTCAETYKNDKEWTVHLVDPFTGNNTQKIDVSDLPNSMKAEIEIPPRFLEYGVYRFCYTVVMTTSRGIFSKMVCTYVKVIASPLLAAMIQGGMSSITRGLDVDVDLEANLYSKDPDVDPDGPQGLTTNYFCKRVDEDLPTKADGSFSTDNPSSPFSASDIKTRVIPDNGGCFRNGPGPVVSSNSGSLSFNTLNMMVNETYVVLAEVKKDVRVAYAKLQIEIVDRVVPSVVILIEPSTPQTGYFRINPDVRLTLHGICTENCAGSRKKRAVTTGGDGNLYKWSIYREGLNNAWITETNGPQYMIGQYSKSIAIKPELFLQGLIDFPEYTDYRIELEMTTPTGDVGSAYTIISVNTPPREANCTIDPLEGAVLLNKFTIDCRNAYDEDGIKRYRFLTIFEGDTLQRQLRDGETSMVSEVDFPLGPHYVDFKEDVYVIIEDNLGATTLQFIETIRVFPMDPDQLRERMEQYIDDDTIDKLAAEGDAQDSNYVYLGIASMLNSYRMASSQEYYDSYVNHPYASSGFVPGANESQIITDPSYIEDDYLNSLTPAQRAIELQKERAKRSDLRNEMLKGLSGLPIEHDPGAIQQMAITITEITKAPEEINRESQGTAMKILTDLLDATKNLDDAPFETKQTLVEAIVSGIAQVMEASVVTINHLLPSDIADAIGSVFYEYDTDLEGLRKAVRDYPTDEWVSVFQADTSVQVSRENTAVLGPQAEEALTDAVIILRDGLIPGEDKISIMTLKLSMSAHKDVASEVLGNPVVEGRSVVDMPDICSMLADPNCNPDQIISLTMMSTSFNPYKASRNGEVVPDSSNILYIELFDENGEAISVTDSEEPIVVIIPQDPSVVVTSEVTSRPDIPQRDGDDFFYHSFNITAEHASMTVIVKPDDNKVQFLVMVGLDTFPKLNNTLRNGSYVTWGLIPKNMDTAEEDPFAYMLFVPQELIDNFRGRAIVALRQLDPSEYDTYDEDNPPPEPEPDDHWEFTTNYTITTVTTGCYYYSEVAVDVDPRNDPKISGMDGQWLSNGCVVQPTPPSQITETRCHCYHLTAFGAGFAVQPNTIDWDFVFSNADFMKNSTLYITEIVILIVFLLAAIWARRKDKKDVLKLGVTPLADNAPNDRYLYEIMCYTGMRKNAGTKSNVYFILSGEYDETDVRTFSDRKRTIFARGQIDSFLLAVPRTLGALNYMRVWHDNSGKGKDASWFLKYLVVQDLQTRDKYYFLGNRWFAVEEDDGQVDRLLPVAGPEQMTEFSHLFSQTTKKNLGDGHLWFSVVARPPQSRFTRLQRVACCLCLLYTSMLANALFYEKTPEATGQNAYTLGPFAFSPQQIFVGFITTIMVFPVNFLIAWMFRKSRPRTIRKSRIREALEKSGQLVKREERRPSDMDHEDMADLLDSPAKSSRDNDTISTISGHSPANSNEGYPSSSPEVGYEGGSYGSTPQNYSGATNPAYSSAPLQPQHKPYGGVQVSVEPIKKKKKKRFSLPWWCVIVAWVLLFLVVAVCAAFVTFFGIMFQDIKCKKWISSLLVSFFTSIFLTQPIKVFLTAIFLSLIFKNPNIDEDDSDDDEDDVVLAPDEMWLHPHPGDPGYIPKPPKVAYQPPDPAVLERARELRFKELRMYDVLREIIFYAFFLWILLVISYGFRDPNAFVLKTSLDRTIIDAGLGQIPTFTDDFKKMRNTVQFWSWMNNTLLPAMRATDWYNGDPPLGQRGFLFDRTSRIMGYATVRQLRIKPGLCETVDSMKPYTPECNTPYNIFEEDDRTMGIGWAPFVGNSTVNNTAAEYTWRSGSELDSLPYWAVHALYGGGGYVFELRGSDRVLREKMTRLFDEGWIDRYTRGVFVEFTIYNAQVNLFAIVTMVAEYLGSAGIWPHYRIEPARLMSYYTSAAVFQVLCEVVYLIFIIFFIVKEARKFWKQRKRYFCEYWNWVEIAIIILSVGAVVMYFYRLFVTSRLTNTFKETHGNGYIKFQYAGYWNELLLYFVGWLVFLATIKFIRLLRFNRRMSLLASTLRYGAKPLLAFGIMFGITFFAFVQFFYLIYFMDLIDFRTIIHSAETCLQMMLGRFNFFEMRGASPVLGPLVFFIYTISVAYILVNMFLSILNESFSAVRSDIEKQSNEYEMVEFIISRFKTWTGIQVPGAQNKDGFLDYDPLNPDKSKIPAGGVHAGFDAKIDNFPEKVDRLMNCISKVYFDRDRFDAIFDSNNQSGKMAMKMMMKNEQRMKSQALGQVPMNQHPNSVPDVD